MARKAAGRAKKGEPTLREAIRASGETPAAARPEPDEAEDLAYLGREFLTWLVYHAEEGGGRFAGAGGLAAFTVSLGGRVALRTPAGMVTEMTLKGPSPATSPDLRYALAGGLAVKEADFHLERGDRVFSFGLAAEHFDLKRVKLPALLKEEDEERADERLALLDELDASLRLAFARFLELRARPGWSRSVVPAIRAWLVEGT